MPIPTELFETITRRFAPDDGPVTAAHAVRLWRALFKRFGPLLGPLSTDLVFARSLMAQAGAYPWLPRPAAGAVREAFAEFEHCLAGRTPADIEAVNRALLSSYTGTLAELIGEGLTSRFLTTAFADDETNKNTEE